MKNTFTGKYFNFRFPASSAIKEKVNYYFSKDYYVFAFLIIMKLFIQLLLLNSGYKWISGDDYSRTIISFQWLEHPKIYAGIWLSLHFWINGLFMLFIHDLFTAATTVNVIFSTATIFYLFKLTEDVFDRKTAFWSIIIFSVFNFQVWLSTSGLPESIYFFFVIGGIYYFIKYLQHRTLIYVFSAGVFFAFANLLRYEGWLFSIVFSVLTASEILRTRKFTKQYILSVLISLISFTTIFWWLMQNYLDFKDAFFFAKETARIYESLNSAGPVQKVFQYPVFIFYIAPITTVLALKVLYKYVRHQNFSLKNYFVLFGFAELVLLMVQGLFGTGGTNMISRYIVINAILLIPMSVYQIFNFRRYIAVSLLAVTIVIYFIWCFYYPQAYREDTYEVGNMLKREFARGPEKAKDKIYFEEVQGSYDLFPIQTLSNRPSKFITGDLTQMIQASKKSKIKSDEHGINVLDLKNYLDKDSIAIAIIRSETYAEKFSRIALRSEEIGDYRIFYFRDRESNVNDSAINLFAKNIVLLKDNPSLLNFNKLLAISQIKVDNTNFGFNPQSVTVDWTAVSPDIIDSIDYNELGFERYVAQIEIKSTDADSQVYIESKKIFSDRNIDDLLQYNSIKTIIVLKPFALLQYSLRNYTSPFESGSYNLSLKLKDTKTGRYLQLYSGDSLMSAKVDGRSDSLKAKMLRQDNSRKDSVQYSYDLGTIIAMFPDQDITKLNSKNASGLYRMMLTHGARLLFSQRYQADYFLNYLFSYF